MSSGQQQSPSAKEIRDEVRRTIQQLTELSRTESDFDQFCETVLANIVKITGAHGAMLWQISPVEGLELTHQFGKYPHQQAREITSPDGDRHIGAVMEVIRKKLPMGLSSEAFTGRPQVGEDPTKRPATFLMLLTPVLDRQQNCRGAIELLQRGDISPQAQEGYLRFLSQVAQLFQRWNEQQDLAKLSHNADQWQERMKFISESHRSIDPTETAYSIANEARRLLKCDRVSVGKWNGRHCKIVAISSQDRFDNRANVVRLLSNVATASVSADTPFWIIGDTDGIAPEVARKINEYLDEAHSRTLAVIPLMARPPQLPDLEMRSRRREKAKKLGVIVLEYFDQDVLEASIEDDCKLIVEQSELALENSRKHNEIFLQPVWKRLGWLQQLLFRDHFSKTMTGLAAFAILMLLMIFLPIELRMKVEGVMQPTVRKTIFSPSLAEVDNVAVEQQEQVVSGQELMRLVDKSLEERIEILKNAVAAANNQIELVSSQLARGVDDPIKNEELANVISFSRLKIASLQRQQQILESRRSDLILKSPIDGTVLTSRTISDFHEMPVTPGTALLTVADLDGPWQLELKIPEGRIAYVDEAFASSQGEPLEVDFIIGTNPNLALKGQLTYISKRAIPSQEGVPEFRAIVEIDRDQLERLDDELRSGAGATVRIRCGKRSLGFVCFYQVYDFLRTTFF
ncbi:MAG: HlyD family efflux transporter periplasmic adaptor subunit [Planctomycetota bacterium]